MNSEELSSLYQIRFPNEELKRKNEIWNVLCKHFFQKHINLSDTIVDIACGYGEFINNISAKYKIAVDLNPDTKNFLNHDIDFYQCDWAELDKIKEREVDIIFTSNFLEHLPDKNNLNIFLDKVIAILKPGGKLLILGPNLRYLPGEYWDFYDHHLGLTHLSLSEALMLKGFSIEVCIDRFLPFTTKGMLPTHPWLVWTYLKLPIAWKFFGRQFFIVAQIPAQSQ